MLTDETLTLYFYGDELDEKESLAIAHALAGDDALARRYAALVADLEFLRDAPAPGLPPKAAVRWHYELDAVATPARPGLPWLVFGTAAAALAFGVAIGLKISMDSPGAPAVPRMSATHSPATTYLAGADTQVQPAFARGLTSYMQASQMQLLALDEADELERSAMLARIIDQNRAFERAAELRGARDIARVLRAFEQVLQTLATEAAAPDDVASDAAQLSFEYSAMLTRLAQRASNEPYTF